MSDLELVPIDFKEACAFIEQHHRHHEPPRGCKFVVAVARDGVIVGVAIVGRPVARHASDTWTAEVTRVCTIDVPPEDQPKQADGTPHASGACAMLYGACWRAARAIGYRRLITYTLPEEGGASLRGAGWTCVGEAGGGSWSRDARPRVDKAPMQEKLRWERQVPDLMTNNSDGK
jgi:hypothetical protein